MAFRRCKKKRTWDMTISMAEQQNNNSGNYTKEFAKRALVCAGVRIKKKQWFNFHKEERDQH
ncbi:hypothetical protein H5410_017324 [Solanum commersonii]|uniref:Uncharacterized protein n=1 Tax=Solanum commersonii TaxID=4109 RepID=A0A9J6A008_SOLCO|nr:hypothetical protein H5410_017324 [Solanum commersonii]